MEQSWMFIICSKQNKE